MSHEWTYSGGIVLGALGGRSWRNDDGILHHTGGTIVEDTSGWHPILSGKTREGKGVGLILPTLLPNENADGKGWWGSVVVHDPKGENWHETARHRSTFSHVLHFDPRNPKGVHWNPFNEIRRGENEIADTMGMIEDLPNEIGNEYGGETIWDTVSIDYGTGAAMFLNNFAPDDWKCLAGLRRFLALGRRAGQMMARNNHPDPGIRNEIREAARRLWADGSDRYISSVLGTLNSYLRIYGDPNIARTTADSDFRVSDIMCADAPISLYLVVRPAEQRRLRPLIKMLLRTMNRQFIHDRYVTADGRAKKNKVLVLLDEFTNFGKQGDMEEIMTYAAGYGVTVWIVVQSLGAILKVYGEDNLFFANGRIVTLRPSSWREKKIVAGLLGDVPIIRTSNSVSRRGSQGSTKTTTTSDATEPLLRPEEMATKLDGKVVVASLEKPLLLDQLTAPFDPRYQDLLGDPPELRDASGTYFDRPGSGWNPWHGVQIVCDPPYRWDIAEATDLGLEDGVVTDGQDDAPPVTGPVPPPERSTRPRPRIPNTRQGGLAEWAS